MGSNSYLRNHLSTVELCYVKHEAVSALLVSSVVMSGGIFQRLSFSEVIKTVNGPHTAFLCTAVVTLVISMSFIRSHYEGIRPAIFHIVITTSLSVGKHSRFPHSQKSIKKR